MEIIITDKGKKSTFEVPEWAAERRILILAGVELLAEKVPWEPWKVKVDRCNFCGQCCMEFKPNSDQTPFGVDDEGKCKALIKDRGDWVCSVMNRKPYMCLHDPINLPECSITKRVIEES